MSITLTHAHHLKVNKATVKLGLSRSDLIALLIDKHAASVTPDYADAYKRLRDALTALGGRLEHHKPNEPRGGTWVLSLETKTKIYRREMRSKQSKRYPELDACYEVRDGVVDPQTWDDRTNDINPAGVAKLFQWLASSEQPRDRDPDDQASASSPAVTTYERETEPFRRN